MRDIEASRITEAVKKLVMDANYFIGDDVANAIKGALETETSATAKEILNIILENHKIAKDEQMPICQDTGVAVFFVDVAVVFEVDVV